VVSGAVLRLAAHNGHRSMRRIATMAASSIQLDYETVVAHSAVGTTWAMQTPCRPWPRTTKVMLVAMVKGHNSAKAPARKAPAHRAAGWRSPTAADTPQTWSTVINTGRIKA
jgi:hypothetical protein